MSNLNNNTTQLEALLTKVNALPEASGEQATPVISVNSANGLITATAGSKSSTHQLAFQAAKTITPGTTNQTAVAAGYYTGGAIMVKGDANLVPSNIVSGKSIFGITGTATTGGSSGDTSIEDGFVTRTLTNYTNSRVTSIAVSAFNSMTTLKSVSFPSVITIGSSAFLSCTNLTSISFPQVTSVGERVFQGCGALTVADFPLLLVVTTYAFNACKKINTANFPVATGIGNYAFNSGISLVTTNFPMAQTIGNSAFYWCTNLTTLSFPRASYIGGYTFAKCFNLKSLYLMGSSICRLSNSNAFSSTPIGGYSTSAGTYGSIYVPASLLASYKAATNWTYFSSRFVGI